MYKHFEPNILDLFFFSTILLWVFSINRIAIFHKNNIGMATLTKKYEKELGFHIWEPLRVAKFFLCRLAESLVMYL